MKNIKKFGAIGLICLIIIIIISFRSNEKLDGKWYLYNGNDINTDSDILKQLNSEEYIEISKGVMKTFGSNGKDGEAEVKIEGSKIHVGDVVYKYDINNFGENKILFLELIYYENSHMKETVENGEKLIYVFDNNIDFE